MAELNTSSASSPGRGRRGPKPLPRVDLTAMVDLAFLLITFFMLTTTLAKNRVQPVTMPFKSKPGKVDERKVLTVCVGKGDRVMWYIGTFEKPLRQPEESSLVGPSLHRQLLEQSRRAIRLSGDPDHGLTLIIKPSDRSNYQNLVDLLDEARLVNATTYAIVDPSKSELDRMKTKGIY